MMVTKMMFNGGSMMFTEDYITVNYGEITVCNYLRCVLLHLSGWCAGNNGPMMTGGWGHLRNTEECISSRYRLERNTPVETL